MRRNWIRRGLKFAVIATIAVASFGVVVMGLWNWLMPVVFGFKAIGFLQALGLLILGRILFGGFHGRSGHGSRWRRGMRERWEQMTPEEREKFQQGMRGRCGGLRTADTLAKE